MVTPLNFFSNQIRRCRWFPILEVKAPGSNYIQVLYRKLIRVNFWGLGFDVCVHLTCFVDDFAILSEVIVVLCEPSTLAVPPSIVWNVSSLQSRVPMRVELTLKKILIADKGYHRFQYVIKEAQGTIISVKRGLNRFSTNLLIVFILNLFSHKTIYRKVEI